MILRKADIGFNDSKHEDWLRSPAPVWGWRDAGQVRGLAGPAWGLELKPHENLAWMCAPVIAALCGAETGASLGFFRNHPNTRDRERHCLKGIKLERNRTKHLLPSNPPPASVCTHRHVHSYIPYTYVSHTHTHMSTLETTTTYN